MLKINQGNPKNQGMEGQGSAALKTLACRGLRVGPSTGVCTLREILNFFILWALGGGSGKGEAFLLTVGAFFAYS